MDFISGLSSIAKGVKKSEKLFTMPLLGYACLFLALTLVHATEATRPVTLSGDCLKRSSQLFCSTFYRSYLSSCLRTVNGESFVLKDNNYCYIPSADTECISTEICKDVAAPKQQIVSVDLCYLRSCCADLNSGHPRHVLTRWESISFQCLLHNAKPKSVI